jgi:Leucine-rich repeat (LRR) protein
VCASLTGLKTLRLAGNLLRSLVQYPAGAGGRHHAVAARRQQSSAGSEHPSQSQQQQQSLPIPGGSAFTPPLLSAFCVLPSLEWLVLEDCGLTTLAADLPPALAASTSNPTATSGDGSSSPTRPPEPGAKRDRASPLQMWFSPLTTLRHLTKLELGSNRLTDAALCAARLYLLPQVRALS